MNFINNIRLKKELKNWKNYKYENSVDALFAKEIATITGFNKLDIHIWIAQKDNNKKFNNFKFEYQKKYYELHNNILKEIDESEIFSK